VSLPTLRPYQEAAIAQVADHMKQGHRNVLLVSPTGCHRAGERVLMFDGATLPAESVNVGDRLMGPDSQPRTVLALCRGTDTMFEVSPVKGAPFYVNGDHVLTLINDAKSVVDVSVRSWLQWHAFIQSAFFLVRVPAPNPEWPYGEDTERTGFSVKELGPESFFGWTLDGDGRYLLADFTVTHNSGKTVCAAEVIRRMRAKGKRALFVAHARELVSQASNKLSDIDVSHGVIMAGEKPTPSDVQVASLHTLKGRALPPADLVVVDEADLARAKTYGDILQHYKDAFVLGMTASPWRGDGRGLGRPDGIFDASTLVATPRQLIDQGYLVPFRSFSFVPLNLDHIKTNRDTGDYNEKQLADAAISTAGLRVIGDVLAKYQEHGGGRRAVMFAASVKHSKILCETFRGAGIPAEHVDATMPRDDRAALFTRVRSGECRVVSTVGILCRGVDIPPIEVAILARPTKSLSLFLQQVGRAMRPSPATGKTHALILDHAGCIIRDGKIVHGLPDDERDYSLGADTKSPTVGAPSITQCRKCFAIFPSGAQTCPQCGAVLGRPRGPGRTDFGGPVLAVSEEDVRKMKKAFAAPDPVREAEYLEYWTIEGRRRGWKTGAPAKRFLAKFGRYPDRAQTFAAERAADAALSDVAAVQR